ncbi:hypothetical protein Cgig2_010005 [Carnegiea gigantea]|uniref:DUF4283 domain-containing protein n=1 Tax=Carnegiea gigantea TaxID=171969 RepID=A0A9Q1Q826_9CARY|nr:hypothetical protein Cgig2_010005 [Carnegiea gigantea]
MPATADDGGHSNCQYETTVDGTPSKSGLGRDEVESQSQANTNIQEIGAQTGVRTQLKSSYASLVDPEEGQNDTAVKIEYWANSILCGVVGSNPPLEYWGMDNLSKLASLLGIPIKTDKVTKEKSAVQFARLLIEMSIEGPFSDYIEFINDKEVVERQAMKYEWKPVKCQHCKMLGHDDMVCRKKKKRVRRTTHRPLTVTTERLPEQNSFMALLEEEAPPGPSRRDGGIAPNG